MTSVTDRKRGRACCPSCRRQQLPPAGAGRVAAQYPSFGRWLPQSAVARCTPYAPLSVGAVGWGVGCPGRSVALPAPGLVPCLGWLPGWLTRDGAASASGLAAGLVGSRRGCFRVGAGCRAVFFSGGRISTKRPFSIVGYSFLRSVVPPSLSQSHANYKPRKGVLNDI